VAFPMSGGAPAHFDRQYHHQTIETGQVVGAF
jgi:hypothetical protein